MQTRPRRSVEEKPATLGGIAPEHGRGQRLLLWLRGLWRSFGYAFAGLAYMLRTQRNAQIHIAITLLVVVAAIFFRISIAEWLALVLAIALVLALEALNTAVEAAVDLAAPRYDPLAKRAKDAAAGAVLIGAIGAAVAGLLVFVPRFFSWLGWLLG